MGWSSRRVTQKHRLIYRVVGTGEQHTIEIIQCKGTTEAEVIASGALRAAKQSRVRTVDPGLRSLPSGRPKAGPGGRQEAPRNDEALISTPVLNT